MKKFLIWVVMMQTLLMGGVTLRSSYAQVISPTPTLTASCTFTPTGICSACITSSLISNNRPTVTPTATLISSVSPTNTLTSTWSSTITPTPTKTLKNTPTITSTPTSTPGVFSFSVSPKPDASNQVHFKWGTTINADHAYLRVFTTGLRPVREFDFSKTEKPEYLSSGLHEITWDGRDEENRPMPPGEYLCFISITAAKMTYEASGKTEIP